MGTQTTENPAQEAKTPVIGLFSFQPSEVNEKPSIEQERAELKKLQQKYRKATHNLKSAVQVARGTGVAEAMRKDPRLYNLRVAIQNLVEAEAANDGKQFHRWFFVMAKAADELENYLEDDDETRPAP
jgi:hypothetical protein